MVELLPNTPEYPRLKIVSISGGTGITRGQHISYTVQLAAHKLHANYVNLNIPLFIEEPTIVARLLKEESIKQCTSMWTRLSCAVVGIGATNSDAPEGLRVPSLDPGTQTVAAVCGWFFDKEGQLATGRGCGKIFITFERAIGYRKVQMQSEMEYFLTKGDTPSRKPNTFYNKKHQAHLPTKGEPVFNNTSRNVPNAHPPHLQT